MDKRRDLCSPELCKQNTLSPNSPNFRRSNILTPCRRVGLSRVSRKSHFSVPFSPIRSASEDSLVTISVTASDSSQGHVEDVHVAVNSIQKAVVSSQGSVERKQRRPGSMVLKKYKFKSPSRSAPEQVVSACFSGNSTKLEQVFSTSKNLAATAFSSSESVAKSCSGSNTTLSSIKAEICDTFKNNVSCGNTLTKKQRSDSDTTLGICDVAIHSDSDRMTGNRPDKYVDKVKCKECVVLLDCNVSITSEILRTVESRVKEKEEYLLGLEQKYQRKHELIAELRELTGRWMAGGQVAALDLLARYRDSNSSATMAQLLANLGIAVSLLHYDPDDETFQ